MIIRKREMISKEITTGEDNLDVYLPYSQASISSDGFLTLRNYDKSNKDKDEIYIFSREETQAIFNLFTKINELRKDLPF